MIYLQKITLENRKQVFNLQIAESQKSFVAPILSSLTTAYLLETNGGCPMPFAIYKDETVVGFVLITYGITSYDLPSFAQGKDTYCILRFLIGEQFQGQGLGRAAFQAILDYISTFPKGKATYCWLDYVPGNEIAKKLYESFGFAENGEVVNGEVVMVKTI